MDQAKIKINHTCALCGKESTIEEYTDPYKEVQIAELLYRNGALVDVSLFLEIGANNNEGHIQIMEIPELCRDCQQKLLKALMAACDTVLHELLPCSMIDAFKRKQEGGF